MKRRMPSVLLFIMIIVASLLLIFPFFSSNAQKLEKTDKTQNQELNALEESVLAKRFYDEMQKNERLLKKSWALKQASFLPKSALTNESSRSLLRFTSDKNQMEVNIVELDNPVKAYFGQLSQGREEKCDGVLCGDGGRKVFSSNGKFHDLSFVKDNYQITIGGDSEKTAMRFASYIIKVIGEK